MKEQLAIYTRAQSPGGKWVAVRSSSIVGDLSFAVYSEAQEMQSSLPGHHVLALVSTTYC